MSRRISSLDSTTVGIDRDIDSQYDNVKTVANNITKVAAVGDNIDAVTSAYANMTDIQNAEENAQAASDSADAALVSENKAQQWAEEAEDVEVDPGEYSSHHWAIKAEASVSPFTEHLAIIDTNGFPEDQRMNTTLSVDEGSRTFSITPSGASFHYYEGGLKYDISGADSVVFTDEEGEHWVYYEEGILIAEYDPTTPRREHIILNHAFVSAFYWNATDKTVVLDLQDERHGISMAPATHLNLHLTRGAQFISGMAIGDVSADGSGATDTDIQYSISAGTYFDEDLLHNLDALALPASIPVVYNLGSNMLLREATSSFGVGVVGGVIQYNEWTGAAWQLTDVPQNDYCLYHIFSFNGQDTGYVAVMGQDVYGNIAQARSGANTEVSNIIATLPLAEMFPIATIIYQRNNGYANSAQARIRSTDTGEDFVDWRTTELVQGASPSSHANLTNVDQAASGILDGHISDQAQTIAGKKTFSTIPDSSATPTASTDLTTKGYVDNRLVGAMGNLEAPLFQLPLKSDINITRGVGTTEFIRTTTATYIDRYGVLQSAAVDEPRFERQGLLIEGPSENDYIYSEDFTNAAWVKTGVTVGASGETAPDGSSNAAVLTDTVGGTSHGITQNVIGGVAGTRYSLSMFIKPGTQSRILLYISGSAMNSPTSGIFDLIAGTYLDSVGTLVGHKIEKVGNGWYRCSVTITADNDGNLYCGIFIQDSEDWGTTTFGYSGDGTGTLHVWGAQLEALDFASSYIPTSGVPVTRARDILEVTDLDNTTGYFEDTTIVTDIDILGESASLTQTVFEHTANLYRLCRVAAGSNYARVFGSGVAAIASEVDLTDGDMHRLACYWSGGEDAGSLTFGIYADGALGAGGAQTGQTYNNTASANGLSLGCETAQNQTMYGHLSNFRIYDRQLTANEIGVA